MCCLSGVAAEKFFPVGWVGSALPAAVTGNQFLPRPINLPVRHALKALFIVPIYSLSIRIIKHRLKITQNSISIKPFAGWPSSYCTRTMIFYFYIKKLRFIATDQIWEGNGLCLLIQIQKYDVFKLHWCIFSSYICRKESEYKNLEVTLCWLVAGPQFTVLVSWLDTRYSQPQNMSYFSPTYNYKYLSINLKYIHT